MKNYKITVIVPVYNIECLIEKCVLSIINQSYKNLEIFLIDDGSIDSSGIICDNLSKKDKRITVIHQKNMGVSATRNRGVELSTGDYISFVDADDYLDSDMYSSMLSSIDSQTVDIIVCGYYINDTPQLIEDNESHIVDRYQAISECINDQENSPFCGAVWNKLFYSETMKNKCFFNKNYTMAEDMLVTLNCLVSANLIKRINCCKYHYVIRSNSVVNTFKKNKSSSIEAHNEMISLLQDFDESFAEVIKIRSLQQSYSLLLQASKKPFKFHSDLIKIKKELRKNFYIIKKSNAFTILQIY